MLCYGMVWLQYTRNVRRNILKMEIGFMAILNEEYRFKRMAAQHVYNVNAPEQDHSKEQ